MACDSGLYEGVDVGSLGGGGLYDDVGVSARSHDSLLYRDMVIVQPRKTVETPYGVNVVDDGGAFYCRCLVDSRTSKSSTFSKNWAQDIISSTQRRGQTETTLLRLMAVEWHGDYYSRVYYEGSVYETDGGPVRMETGSDTADHWEIVLRMVANGAYTQVDVPTPEEGSPVWGE